MGHPEVDYQASCAALNPAVPTADLLDLVDCGVRSNGANFHGFVPKSSKADTFKIDRRGLYGTGDVG